MTKLQLTWFIISCFLYAMFLVITLIYYINDGIWIAPAAATLVWISNVIVTALDPSDFFKRLN